MKKEEYEKIRYMLIIGGIIFIILGFFVYENGRWAYDKVDGAIDNIIDLGGDPSESNLFNKLSEHSQTKIHGITISVIGVILCITGLALPHIISFEEIKEIKKKPLQSKKEDESLELLKKRYAKGEITREEFTQMKKDIES